MTKKELREIEKRYFQLRYQEKKTPKERSEELSLLEILSCHFGSLV